MNISVGIKEKIKTLEDNIKTLELVDIDKEKQIFADKDNWKKKNQDNEKL